MTFTPSTPIISLPKKTKQPTLQHNILIPHSKIHHNQETQNYSIPLLFQNKEQLKRTIHSLNNTPKYTPKDESKNTHNSTSTHPFLYRIHEIFTQRHKQSTKIKKKINHQSTQGSTKDSLSLSSFVDENEIQPRIFPTQILS